jgi:hypothetical protein
MHHPTPGFIIFPASSMLAFHKEANKNILKKEDNENNNIKKIVGVPYIIL